MTKVVGPLFSLDARKSLGKAITYSIWKGVNYVRRLVVPQNPQTTCQTVIRKIVNHASIAWKNAVTGITATEQALWNTAAEGTAESGFNRYMRAFIAENYSTPCTMQTPNVFPTPAQFDKQSALFLYLKNNNPHTDYKPWHSACSPQLNFC